MSFAHFIARRILADRDRQDRLSRPIVVIAVVGIVIGMAVMVLTVAITSGFQRTIRTKVADASAHLVITSISQTDPKETPRILIDDSLLKVVRSVPGVKHIQAYATKPGIIETPEEIQGVVVKGVDAGYDWSAMRPYIAEGAPLVLSDTARSPDVLISRHIAGRLRIRLYDTITIYLVRGREDIRPRKFRVGGLFETGIERIDHQLVIIDLGHLQRFSGWGLQAEIQVGEVEEGRYVTLEGLAFGGDRSYRFEWPGTDLHGPGPHRLQLWHWHEFEYSQPGSTYHPRDTTFTLVVYDEHGTVPDTATIHLVPERLLPITHSLGTDQVVQGMRVERSGSGGSHRHYAGGFEITADDFDRLPDVNDAVYRALPVNLRCESVTERFPEIFAWLELLDTNVIVVIVLMVVVAIINMTSALLIIILERTPMIGVLKALGATNGTVRRIFLIDAAYILGAGILLGDLLGVGLCLLQQWTGLVTLPIESYYVDVVPVDLDVMPILLLNAGTLAVCVLALVLPSLLVARIAPVKAIRFD